MRYTEGENPMVIDRYDGPRVVDMCDDCGTDIYEEDVCYDIRGRTLCKNCGLEWLDVNYGRMAE